MPLSHPDSLLFGHTVKLHSWGVEPQHVLWWGAASPFPHKCGSEMHFLKAEWPMTAPSWGTGLETSLVVWLLGLYNSLVWQSGILGSQVRNAHLFWKMCRRNNSPPTWSCKSLLQLEMVISRMFFAITTIDTNFQQRIQPLVQILSDFDPQENTMIWHWGDEITVWRIRGHSENMVWFHQDLARCLL